MPPPPTDPTPRAPLGDRLEGCVLAAMVGAVSLPVLFDEDQEVSRSFMVRGLPTTVVIARDGTLAGRAVGPRAWDSPEAVAVMRQIMENGK